MFSNYTIISTEHARLFSPFFSLMAIRGREIHGRDPCPLSLGFQEKGPRRFLKIYGGTIRGLAADSPIISVHFINDDDGRLGILPEHLPE
jgi:hypothetical protein